MSATITIEVWKELLAWLFLLITSSALVGLIVSAWIHQNEKWSRRRFLRRRDPMLHPFWDYPQPKNNSRDSDKN